MARYGNELSLLDATYRTTRYALPLFFVVVKTNVDYQVVGVFVSESETQEIIEEALSILKGWNPEWNPLYFMTDYCQEEIGAIKKIFGIKSILFFVPIKNVLINNYFVLSVHYSKHICFIYFDNHFQF